MKTNNRTYFEGCFTALFCYKNVIIFGDIILKHISVIKKIIDWDYYEEHFDELVDKLYPQRKDSVLRLKRRKPAIVSLAAGIMLQDVVLDECGLLSQDINVETNDNGKPHIKGYEDFHYNISHSGERIVLAYGNCPVGIDIERIGETDLKVARRCFDECENEYIQKGRFLNEYVDDASVNQRFFTVWTMKEAYLKYKGTGISVPLNSFQVNPKCDSVKEDTVLLKHFVDDGYLISVCVDNDVESIDFVSG